MDNAGVHNLLSRMSQRSIPRLCSYSEDPYKIINIALVICWATRTWSQVQSRTISRCFSKCRFLQNEGPVANIGMPEVTLEELELHAMDISWNISWKEN